MIIISASTAKCCVNDMQKNMEEDMVLMEALKETADKNNEVDIKIIYIYI